MNKRWILVPLFLYLSLLSILLVWFGVSVSSVFLFVQRFVIWMQNMTFFGLGWVVGSFAIWLVELEIGSFL